MHIIIGLIVVAVIAAGAVLIQQRDTTEDVPVAATSETVELETDSEAARESTANSEAAAATELPTAPTDSADPAVSQLVDTAPPTSTESSVFADGTYTAPASYFTPRRTEHEMDITLTITDGIVTDATVTYDGAAAQTPNHTRFDEAYSAEIIGVALADVSLARTGGASLTSDAFNEAVDTIKQQAS